MKEIIDDSLGFAYEDSKRVTDTGEGIDKTIIALALIMTTAAVALWSIL
jgi:hypothetical protein